MFPGCLGERRSPQDHICDVICDVMTRRFATGERCTPQDFSMTSSIRDVTRVTARTACGSGDGATHVANCHSRSVVVNVT